MKRKDAIGFLLASLVGIGILSAAADDRGDAVPVQQPVEVKTAPETPDESLRSRQHHTKWRDEITGEKSQIFCLDKDGVFEEGYSNSRFCIKDDGERSGVFFSAPQKISWSMNAFGGIESIMEIRIERNDGSIKKGAYLMSQSTSSPNQAFISDVADVMEFTGSMKKFKTITVRVATSNGPVTMKFSSQGVQ